MLPQWPVRSQQRARRNALLASTALADRRRERLEVEEFLSSLDDGPAAGVRVPAQRDGAARPQRIG
jgi:hypothetical protein